MTIIAGLFAGSFGRLLVPCKGAIAALKALGYGKKIGPVSALLLADNGYALLIRSSG